MKHIKKKYLLEFSIGNGLDRSTLTDNAKFIPLPSGKFAKAFTEKIKVNNKEVMFDLPIPDLSLVYYNMAYLYGKNREALKDSLGKKLNSLDLRDEDVNNEVYNYFGISCSCIILIFTSLESFMNSILPDEATYKKNMKKGIEEFWNKEKIQRNISFNEKITKVLPSLLNRGMDCIPDSIWLLKELRDEIIHTKSNIDFSIQEKLMTDILRFNFEKCLLDIKSFMNFYKPDYIEDCECGNDF